jgi:hypothetical protein
MAVKWLPSHKPCRGAIADQFCLVIPVRSKYSNMLKPWVMGLRASNGFGKTLRANSGPVWSKNWICLNLMMVAG